MSVRCPFLAMTSPSGEPVVIVVAHGSRAVDANDLHREICRSVGERIGLDTRPAFLELAEPSIAEAIDAAITDGAARIVIHPMFLLPGNHTLRDIPEAIAAARERHPDAAIELTAHVGADGLDVLVARSVELHLAADPSHGSDPTGRLEP